MSNQVTDPVLAQYEKNNQSGGSAPKLTSEERLKLYFSPILAKGVKSGEKRIRILPSKDGSSPFVEVYFHEFLVDGKWVKLYDPSQNGNINAKSPLNEVYSALRMTGSEADRTLSLSYRPRLFYVVKVIDRENEQDGVKFWRFKHSAKKDGIFDKLYSIWKLKGDITNPETGRDLILSLNLTKNPSNGKEYCTVTSIIPDDKTPITENQEQKTTWLENELGWSDVYSKKPIEYLEGVASGFTPKWNNDLKKFVYGDEAESTSISGGANVPEAPDSQAGDDADDDLPF